MSTIPFSVVDVFSETPFKGNPLAVVNDLSQNLTDTQMKLITRQFNLSETTFVNPPTVPGADYRLRSFLPDGKEVFGAGHNSLGALWWLVKHGYLSSKKWEGNSLHFHQQMGPDALPVSVTRKNQSIEITLYQAVPQFHGTHPNTASLAEALGIAESDIGFSLSGKEITKAQVVSTSTTRHLLVPVANENVLNSISLVDRARLTREITSADPLAYGLYLFTPSPEVARDRENYTGFQARFFSPGMSSEDPATGSAAGPLGAYLHKAGAHIATDGDTQRILVLQGVKVGRACFVAVNTTRQGGQSTEVKTSLLGGGVEVASGHIAIPNIDTEF